FNSLMGLARWFAGMGYKGVQIPAWDRRVFDLDQASESRGYCEDFRGRLAELGLEVTEVAGYLHGQVLAIHPAYAVGFAGFHPPGLEGEARTAWAAEGLKKCVLASSHLGLRNIPVLSGGF